MFGATIPANCDNSKTPHPSGPRNLGKCGKMLCRFLSTAKWPLRGPGHRRLCFRWIPGRLSAGGCGGCGGCGWVCRQLGTPRRRVTFRHKKLLSTPPPIFFFLPSSALLAQTIDFRSLQTERHTQVCLSTRYYTCLRFGESLRTHLQPSFGGTCTAETQGT